MSASRLIAKIACLCLLTTTLALLASCDEATDPVLPGGITAVSGDNQYSKVGTAVPDPLVVEVRLEDGSIASGVSVRFQAIDGGGSVTKSTAKTDGNGVASTHFTLGPSEGLNRVRASLADDSSINVDFSATAGAFFCPEQDPTFVQRFFPLSVAGGLLLFTRESNLNTQGNTTIAGIISMSTASAAGTLSVDTQSEARWEENEFSINVPRDLAFAASGELFGVWTADEDEVIKISPGGIESHFAQAVGFLGTEIATAPKGIVVGVDEFGLFSLGCRDSLERFQEARFSGMGNDRANDDALAVDQNSGDAYFIYHGDNYVYRLPIDSLSATGPIEQVTELTLDEAEGANGMVVDNGGIIYILVDTDNTKALLKVDSGTKSVYFDFFSRGAGDAAGIQNDLAINQDGNVFYTLDTLNNKLLLLQKPIPQLFEASAETTGELSSPSSGERVGLVWMPKP